MKFEWDQVKSKSNILKHGIGFKEATQIWNSVYVQIDNLARSRDGEMRHAVVGEALGKIWAVFFTKRKKAVRIISVRRARENEKEAFYEKIRREGSRGKRRKLREY